MTSFRETRPARRPALLLCRRLQGWGVQDAAKEIDWFLRVVDWPGKGPVLLGQGRKGARASDGPIYEMAWDGKKYKEARRSKRPKLFSVYGFAPFEHKGKSYYVFIDADFRLKVTDAKGKVVWKSTDFMDRIFVPRPCTWRPRGA